MTNAELRRLAESLGSLEPWWTDWELVGRDIDIDDARYIAAASPDVIIALLDRCERAEAIAAAHETQPEYRRMVSWTDDVTGDVYGQTADDLTLAEAHAFTARNEVAIAIRNFFRDLRIDTLRARCEALEKERDAARNLMPWRSDVVAFAELADRAPRCDAAEDLASWCMMILRAHAAKGGE